ncbi:TrbG/VirB9 family P-type conjugative transfer protein [Paracoccus sp. MC1862]|uniref:TrbG/VirB9 family P-type conjugative transfer protein n=1 Tax=Paracoccus sp. MC1862 TaxID=2760307 RepID=UPI0015FF4D30|nr:TrbG/VirB9 family P-type conjugative transfer protein [Paracoccus sp. MC1862]MBB1499114.1 TrbG/VirB9 family P-type conjugative transfer protein [Paracoccus sp. MC1862]QQO46576.1 TrbG/VirB9 family P-type conjugative transfer protein [Paracoccus sp. MC1862]
MIRLTTIAALIALTVPAAVLAEARPRAGGNDSRVTYATFQEGQVYTVHTRVRNVTLVELGDGETIRSIAIGDSEAFQVDKLEGPNVFTIKPVLDGASTNLTVETNRRFYFINVVESSRVTPNWSVKFTVPGSGGTRSRAANAAAIPAEPPMTYRVLNRKGAAEFAPVGISDDGKRTLFQIPPGAPIPSIFRADARGRETSVNSSVNGTIITVGARSERWVLRFGDEHVCVEGTKPGEGRRAR